MAVSDLDSAYQWNYRPRVPPRPEWFKEWPGGNRIAFTLSIMHEWESVPGALDVFLFAVPDLAPPFTVDSARVEARHEGERDRHGSTLYEPYNEARRSAE